MTGWVLQQLWRWTDTDNGLGCLSRKEVYNPMCWDKETRLIKFIWYLFSEVISDYPTWRNYNKTHLNDRLFKGLEREGALKRGWFSCLTFLLPAREKWKELEGDGGRAVGVLAWFCPSVPGVPSYFLVIPEERPWQLVPWDHILGNTCGSTVTRECRSRRKTKKAPPEMSQEK